MSPLQVAWFFLVGILLTGYAALDGFDLGLGFWYLAGRDDRERRTFLRAIGPVWDGNEVWLVAGGGALFAAFPDVYAAVFSGLYPAMMLVLLALIARGVAFEFRHHGSSPHWRRTWDIVFATGSVMAALLFGVALGNLLRGLPVDARGNIAVDFLDLLNPFALLVGLLGLAAFATHGAAWLALKTEGPLADRARRWAQTAATAALILFTAVVIAAARYEHLRTNYVALPLLWALPLSAAIAIGAVVVLARRGGDRAAFLSSASAIILTGAAWGAALFPNLVPARGPGVRSLTLANASSSPHTLELMLTVALIGMPVVVTYTAWVYRTFRGKVRLDDPDEEGY